MLSTSAQEQSRNAPTTGNGFSPVFSCKLYFRKGLLCTVVDCTVPSVTHRRSFSSIETFSHGTAGKEVMDRMDCTSRFEHGKVKF